MSTEDQCSDRPRSPIAERLNELFATVTYERGGRQRTFSTPHVAKAICDDPSHGTTLSRVYLNGLRNGTNTNPTVAVVRALAKFFDEHRPPDSAPITAAHLLGDEDAADRALCEKLADHRLRAIALRACGMDERLRERALEMLDVLDPPGGRRPDDH